MDIWIQPAGGNHHDLLVMLEVAMKFLHRKNWRSEFIHDGFVWGDV